MRIPKARNCFHIAGRTWWLTKNGLSPAPADVHDWSFTAGPVPADFDPLRKFALRGTGAITNALYSESKVECPGGKVGMSGDPISNMRQRAEQCRRLAAGILDQKATQALLQMALEIEADIARLETERAAPEPRAAPPNPP